MNRADIDIGHDKGLGVPYVTNATIEIVDKGHDKGQSVPYNTIAVVSNESGHDKGQGEKYRSEVGNKGAIAVLTMVCKDGRKKASL